MVPAISRTATAWMLGAVLSIGVPAAGWAHGFGFAQPGVRGDAVVRDGVIVVGPQAERGRLSSQRSGVIFVPPDTDPVVRGTGEMSISPDANDPVLVLPKTDGAPRAADGGVDPLGPGFTGADILPGR